MSASFWVFDHANLVIGCHDDIIVFIFSWSRYYFSSTLFSSIEIKNVKTFENSPDSVNICPQWRTQGYTDSRDMGLGWGICTRILFRIGETSTWCLVLLLKSVTWKVGNWCIMNHLILFCSLEPVECHFLGCDLTKYVYSTILEETRTTVVKSALSFQVGPDNTVDELRPSLPSNLSRSWCQSPKPLCMWLLLFCFFTQRQRNTFWAVPGLTVPWRWKMISCPL